MGKGINVYDEVRPAHGSILESTASELEKRAPADEPCIFLSHKGEDTEPVRVLGEYIKEKGIYIYLDAEDDELQQAVHDGDDEKITQFIERAIRCSSDVMVCISPETQKSWWVPYEIGYGKSAKKVMSCLKLKDVEELPSFLEIVERLRNTQELDDYLLKVRQRVPFAQITKGARGELIYEIDAARHLLNLLLESESSSKPHPLAGYVDEA